MRTVVKDINLTRGDSLGFNFKIKNFTGDLTSCFLSCKSNPDDENYLFQKSIGNGITSLGNGEYYVKIEPSDTENFECDTYYYDLQLQLDNDVYTILKGRLYIEWDITKGGV